MRQGNYLDSNELYAILCSIQSCVIDKVDLYFVVYDFLLENKRLPVPTNLLNDEIGAHLTYLQQHDTINIVGHMIYVLDIVEIAEKKKCKVKVKVSKKQSSM